MAVLLLFTSVSVMAEFSCDFVYLNLDFSWFRMLKSNLKYVEGGIKKFNLCIILLNILHLLNDSFLQCKR